MPKILNFARQILEFGRTQKSGAEDNLSQSNYILILKISSENIEKWKAFCDYREAVIGNFGNFWQFCRLTFHISTNIKL